MLGERLKKAVSESRLTAEEVANGLGISKSNLYVLYKKDSFELEYVKKASQLLGLSVSYFLDEEKTETTKSADGGAFGNSVLQEIRQEMRMLREQLIVKDQQMAGLQRTIDALVGKSEGATNNPLSFDEFSMEVMYHNYTQATYRNLISAPVQARQLTTHD